MKKNAVCAVGGTLVVMLAAAAARGSITFGQLDDFQGGSVLGWQQGAVSQQQPSIISTGGPTGSGDEFLENISSGGFGAGSKQIMFNQAQWTGNYASAGVTRIDAQMANLGSTPLSMRVALRGGTAGTYFSSTNAVALPADGKWHPVTFNLTASALTVVDAGTDSLADVLGSVTELRILSAASGPARNGDTIASTLGVDDIRALTLPGDANHDGTVDFADLVTLARHYGTNSATWESGDFNFDGNVGFDDLVLLARNYGQRITAAQIAALDPVVAAQVQAAFAQAPEPLILSPIGFAMLLLKCRRGDTKKC